MYCKKERGKIIYVFAISAFAPAVFAAIAFAGIFDNASNVSGFKAKIKRDIFYTDEEKENIKAILTGQQPLTPAPAQPSQPQPPQPALNQPQTAAPVSQPVEKPAPSENENFSVEGIIKLGDRGCAIINSKIWYVGKPNLGYELIKLHDEAVEIKTPDGRILKCKLVKEKPAQ